jgi:hypothetical protein
VVNLGDLSEAVLNGRIAPVVHQNQFRVSGKADALEVQELPANYFV